MPIGYDLFINEIIILTKFSKKSVIWLYFSTFLSSLENLLKIIFCKARNKEILGVPVVQYLIFSSLSNAKAKER